MVEIYLLRNCIFPVFFILIFLTKSETVRDEEEGGEEIRKEKSGGGRQFYHVNHPELLVIIAELVFLKIYFSKFQAFCSRMNLN